MALTADRNTPRRDGTDFRYGVKGAAHIYAGALVVLDGGYAKPGAAGVGLVTAGRAEAQVDNTDGNDGDVDVPVRRGTFRFANSAAGDAITAADIGASCYVVDDETVAKTDGEGARSKAGIVRDVDALGVWVEI